MAVATEELATFEAFPLRQLGLSAGVSKTTEGIQSQILKLKQRNYGVIGVAGRAPRRLSFQESRSDANRKQGVKS